MPISPTHAQDAVPVPSEKLLDRLNAQQREAVCQGWGPSLIVAGAGSGKTTVLTRRLAYLISGLEQPPHSILAVTFTNKAASEMKTRVEKIAGEDIAGRITIGTFHSVCARLLRREIQHYRSPAGQSWKSNFVIYDETDTLNVVKAVVAKLNLDEKVFAPKEMVRAISALKNDGLESSRFAAEARNYRDQRIAEIFTAYEAELAKNNALDFDDLILVFTELLAQNEELRHHYRERFKHVLVDEFQDTNQSQYRLVQLLSPTAITSSAHRSTRLKSNGGSAGSDAGSGEETSGAGLAAAISSTLAAEIAPTWIDQAWDARSLMVVGDVDQSIYSWRKADFRIILGFQKDYPNARLIKLEENYRSTERILQAANSVIINNEERIEKVLRCNRGPGGKIRCYAAADEIDEAYFAVEELKRLKARGLPLSGSVLLYRTNAQSRAIEEVLVRNNIPYTMIGGTRFYDRAEIKDMMGYLRLIYNPADSQAFNRVINNPRRGLGKTTLDRLSGYADMRRISLLDAAQQARDIEGVAQKTAKTLMDFAVAVARWRIASGAVKVSQLVELVLNESGYLKKLEEESMSSRDETAAGRIENLREFVNVAREFENLADSADLESFLTRISLVSDLDSLNGNEDTVKLMTLHSAKGLEFPTVFLLGLEEGLFPHVRSLNSPSALEEERRLMYVGITRAEDRLYLTYCRKRNVFTGNFTGTNYTIPSRFLSEIAPECLSGFQPDAESSQAAGAASRYAENSRTWSSGAGTAGWGQGETPALPQADPGRSSARPAAGNQDKPRVLSRSGPAPVEEKSHVPSPSFERLAVGDRVMHSKFGVGQVSQVIGEGDKELYNVDFQTAGKRLLDPRFARLVKLD